MSHPRQAPFRYESMPLLGKVSSHIASTIVTRNLVPGIWLDVLSGARALLQVSQLRNPSIRAFHALDHSLDGNLEALGLHTTECHIDRTLPYPDSCFDNITIINGLEHLWHPQDILNEAFRTLRPYGVLQVMVPTWFGKPFLEFVAFTMKNPAARLEMNDHKMYYNEQQLWPMLVEAGFQPRGIHLRRTKVFCSLYGKAVKLEPDVIDR